MMRMPRGEYPSFFLVTLFYQKLFLFVAFAAIFGFAANDVLPWVPVLPEPLLFSALVASIAALAAVNFGLFLGRKLDFLDVPADPVPFRFLFQRRKR